MTAYLRTNKKREKVIAVPTTVEHEGHTILITPLDKKPGNIRGSGPFYVIAIDGVERAWASRVQTGYLGGNSYRAPSWAIWSFGAPLVHYGTRQLREYRECSVPNVFLKEVVTYLIKKLDDGYLPSMPEAEAALVAADADKVLKDAANAASRERAKREAAEQEQAVIEAHEGLIDIKTRLGDQLTNFEMAAVTTAISRMKREAEDILLRRRRYEP